jgi:branched-chain amino acid aminotransferase
VIDYVRHAEQRLSDAARQKLLTSLSFGRDFTDHMVTVCWTSDHGWHDGRIEPRRQISLDPAAAVLHYGQAIFEGMKAYRHADGTIALFRPEANAVRFNLSAQRLAMPTIPVDDFIRAVEMLVQQDSDWVPEGLGNSLYLRPFMIATQPALGFTLPSTSYLFSVIASPVPALFGSTERARALTAWVSEDYSRAAPGGTGAAKAAGNYAAAFLAQREATDRGCDQVIWLDAVHHRWIEEMGGMNLFLVRHDAGGRPILSTPPLTGTLLPGVTRDSILRLAPLLDIATEERATTIDEWREWCAEDPLSEAFACGTAAVIAGIGRACTTGGDWTVGDGGTGPTTRQLRDELLGIQYGRRPDPFGWVRKVC